MAYVLVYATSLPPGCCSGGRTWEPRLAKLFKSILIRRGLKRAIFALAHKILKIVFVLISRGDYYRDATVDYEAMSVERNAPIWIRMLKKYGYLGATSGAAPASC